MTEHGTWNIRLFRRKAQPSPTPLRIEGIAPAPITPEPDDAEMAAAALLEELAAHSAHKAHEPNKPQTTPAPTGRDGEGPAYYHQLAAHIRSQRAEEERAAMRWVTWGEALLDGSVQKPDGISEEEQIAQLCHGLYDRMDTIERVGGELKRRWQHCLAEVTVLMMGPLSGSPRGGEKLMTNDE